MSLSKEEAAKFLGVSVRSVENYVKQGKIGVKYVKGSRGRKARYEQSELEELRNTLTQETHKPTLVPETSQSPENLAPQNYQLAETLEKFIIPIASAFTEMTRAVERIEQKQPDQASISVPIESKILLTLKEARALTSMSENSLREAIKAEELPAKRLGRGWKIKRTDLDRYVENL